MRIIDCEWELKNIGKKTCEVLIDKNDIVDDNLLHVLDSEYEYQVVKVDPDNIAANIKLGDNGFHLVETQIDLELKYQEFNFNDSLIKYIEPDISFKDINEREGFEGILNRVTPEMFITDRIALDPYFGLDYSYMRYCNWMKTAFDNQTAQFLSLQYKGEGVGFSMYRIKDGIWHGDLGGIFPSAGVGLGLMLVSGGFIYIKQRGLNIKKIVTSISSNNASVIQPYNYCHFSFKKFKYVFVKHKNSSI